LPLLGPRGFDAALNKSAGASSALSKSTGATAMIGHSFMSSKINLAGFWRRRGSSLLLLDCDARRCGVAAARSEGL
jgi:hypothetical protein